MRSIAYYSFDDLDNPRRALNECSAESDRLPLVVNCAGSFYSLSRFFVDNVEGRLDYYLLYMTKGRLSMHFPEGDRELSEGDFVLIPPNTRYRYAHVDGGELSYFWVHFTGSQSKALLQSYGLDCYPTVHSVEEDGGVGRKIRPLFDAFALQDRFRDRELGLLCERLLLFLARRVANGGRRTHFLTASLRLLHSSYHEDLRVPRLAKEENLSVSRYNAVFRSQLGTSPMEYLTKIRMSTACDLLSNTDLPIKEIAMMVGYTDSHFFSRVFRTRLGVSPRVYRDVGGEGRRQDEV